MNFGTLIAHLSDLQYVSPVTRTSSSSASLTSRDMPFRFHSCPARGERLSPAFASKPALKRDRAPEHARAMVLNYSTFVPRSLSLRHFKKRWEWWPIFQSHGSLFFRLKFWARPLSRFAGGEIKKCPTIGGENSPLFRDYVNCCIVRYEKFHSVISFPNRSFHTALPLSLPFPFPYLVRTAP